MKHLEAKAPDLFGGPTPWGPFFQGLFLIDAVLTWILPTKRGSGKGQSD